MFEINIVIVELVWGEEGEAAAFTASIPHPRF
jgi:hypothetical protein